MAVRPSFQFFPADWRNNGKLRRCSPGARGSWIDILCVLHDSDEYGVVRWPLADLARAANITLKHAQELAMRGVLKGGDHHVDNFVFRPFHAGRHGEPVTLVECKDELAPCWFSSRLVRDEWIRKQRGKNTRFGPENPSPKWSPTQAFGDGAGAGFGDHGGDGLSSSSPSSSSQESIDRPSSVAARKNISNDFVVGKRNGKEGRGLEGVTLQDPDLRLLRFMEKLAKEIPDPGWIILSVAMDPTASGHERCLAKCVAAAQRLGKGWPHNWPTDHAMFDRLVNGRGILK